MPQTITKKQNRFHWATGRKGLNRVLLNVSPRSGMLTLQWFEKDPAGLWKRRFRSLGHRDIKKGKTEAENHAEALRQLGGTQKGVRLALGALFEIYEREELPQKGSSAQAHNRRAFSLFLRQFGTQRDVSTLGLRDWANYIAVRRSGALAPGGTGQPVRNRIIEQDLQLLTAVLNWATHYQYLERNPCKGFEFPSEINVSRPMLKTGQYETLLDASRSIDPRLTLALILCNETGHRLNSVRQLLWGEINFTEASIFWRAASDKMRRAHTTPLSPAAEAALKDELQRQ